MIKIKKLTFIARTCARQRRSGTVSSLFFGLIGNIRVPCVGVWNPLQLWDILAENNKWLSDRDSRLLA